MVFISYSSIEYNTASNVRSILQQNGIECWMAPESIPAGSDYGEEIPTAIENCDAFVLILSENAQNSRWVPREIDLAITNDKIIIPLHIDDKQLNRSFNFRLINAQRIEAHHRAESAFAELIKRIQIITNTNPEPQQAQTQETNQTTYSYSHSEIPHPYNDYRSTDTTTNQSSYSYQSEQSSYSYSHNSIPHPHNEYKNTAGKSGTSTANPISKNTQKSWVLQMEVLRISCPNITHMLMASTHEKTEKLFEKLQKTFAPYSSNERPLAAYDSSLFGSGKEGYLVTNRKVYVCSSRNKGSVAIPFEKISKWYTKKDCVYFSTDNNAFAFFFASCLTASQASELCTCMEKIQDYALN